MDGREKRADNVLAAVTNNSIPRRVPSSVTTSPDGGPTSSDIEVVVAERTTVAEGVIALELRRPDGDKLPDWEPGAHIDVVLDDDTTRQYSLCGSPAAAEHYRIAVLREESGRGGSRRIHDNVHNGSRLRIRGPRNHFPLEPTEEYVFIAGGIGVTPILPMIAAADAAGRRWHLLYGGRTRHSMPFTAELRRRYEDRVTIVPQEEYGLLDLGPALDGTSHSALVYCCGPEPLLAAVETQCAEHGLATRLRLERFTPMSQDETHNEEFEVELVSDGRRLRVPADRTLLETLRDAGVDILSSCEEGTCGSCESDVISGVPDHRDSVLTDEEREQGDRIMVCVSRSRSPLLVLDL